MDGPGPTPHPYAGLALALSGGGARAAYQVGLLRCLGKRFPDLRIPIVTGVSAGAINAVHLAAHRERLPEAAESLTDLWRGLTFGQVFHTGAGSLSGGVWRWAMQLVSGGNRLAPAPRSLLDTTPLRRLLERVLPSVDGEIVGLADNVAHGRLHALALSTLSYATSQTITWVQGAPWIETWERPQRRAVRTRIGIDHVMASAALPLAFPAVEISGSWYGDGGVRLAAPLAPAIHLGASRLLVISTRYDRSQHEADQPLFRGYPPLAQVAGTLMNAIFLDIIDQDAYQLARINRILADLPEERRHGLRPVELLVLRPSVDLGKLSASFESDLPRAFRFLTRGLGTRRTASPDLLSMLMFHPEYTSQLIEIGERDAAAQMDRLAPLILGERVCPLPPPEVPANDR